MKEKSEQVEKKERVTVGWGVRRDTVNWAVQEKESGVTVSISPSRHPPLQPSAATH